MRDVVLVLVSLKKILTRSVKQPSRKNGTSFFALCQIHLSLFKFLTVCPSIRRIVRTFYLYYSSTRRTTLNTVPSKKIAYDARGTVFSRNKMVVACQKNTKKLLLLCSPSRHIRTLNERGHINIQGRGFWGKAAGQLMRTQLHRPCCTNGQ